MKVLFDAIMTKYNASTALKAANTGGLHREVAPQNARLPYTVMHQISGKPRDTFTEFIENYIIQFNIYDSTASDDSVDDIFTKLTAAFDYCTLTISGYTHVIMRRVLNQSFFNEDEASRVWQYVVQYEIEMQKT